MILILFLIPFFFAGCSSDVTDDATYYYVSYTSQAGTCPSPKKVESGTVLDISYLPNLTSSGYVFKGWYLDGTKINSGEYTVKSNITLTASWICDDTEVTFTCSSNVKGETFSRPYSLGQVITLPFSPYGEIAGLDFKGWLCDGVFYAENEKYTVTQSVTFTAYYAEKGTYTISYYNVLDGFLLSDNSSFSDITYLTGSENPLTFSESEAVFISGLSKAGYTFGGWYTSSSCSQSAVTYWLFSQKSEDQKFYAKWTTNKYTITFDGNSASLNASDVQEDITKTYSEDEKFYLPECKYFMPGYTFAAWSLSKDSYDNEFTCDELISLKDLLSLSDSTTITLYAHWKDITSPDSPTLFTVDSVDKTSVTLSWTACNSDDLAYTRLYFKKKTDSTYEYQDFPAETYKKGKSCSYTVEGLETGAVYTFTVSSYDVAGNANTNNDDCTLIAVPRSYNANITLSQRKTTSMTVSWEIPTTEEYPLLKDIQIYLNDDLKETISDKNSECFTISECTLDVAPLNLYEVELVFTEYDGEDKDGTLQLSYKKSLFTEPDFNVSVGSKNKDGSDLDYYRYTDKLKFDITPPVTSETYTIYASYKDTSSSVASLETTLTKDSTTGLYFITGLESGKTYDVSIYVEVFKTLDDGKEYSSCSNLCAKNLTCNTAVSCDSGYLCYKNGSSFEYYYDVQPSSYEGTFVGYVCSVDELKQPVLILSENDYQETKEDSSIVKYFDYESALANAESYDAGNLNWSLPTKAEIEEIFNGENSSLILSAISKKEGKVNFTEPEMTSEGMQNGLYVTQTVSEDDSTKVYVFAISETLCSEAILSAKDGTSGIFAVRAVSKSE